MCEIHFNSLGILITNNLKCTCEFNQGACGKSSIQQEDTVTRILELHLRVQLVKCYIWGIPFHVAETWTLQKLDHKYLESLKCDAGEGLRRSIGPIV